MLLDLFIKNLAIIDTLHVTFHPGLTILTGETGAGKSIIIDAVNLIMGGRASADLVRTGVDEATVEAVFALPEGTPLAARLAEAGIECTGELLVKRVVSRAGRNRVFIGGSLSTLTILSDIAGELINIYGQHESQTLLRTDNHLTLLDGFRGILPLREAYGALYVDYRSTLDRLRALEEGEREAARRLDLLAFQSQEIREAALSPGEDEDLERERGILAHGEKLLCASQEAYAALYGDDGAVLDRLAEVKGKVAGIAAIDESLAPLAASLADTAAQLEDAAFTLRDYASRVEADPARLERVEERLDQIRRLKKKYAPTVEGIIAYGEETDREIEAIENRGETRVELEAALSRLRDELDRKGAELSAERRIAAKELKKAMEGEIHQLAMKHALFEVAFEDLPEPRATGLERVEFLLAPNPGEAPKPLSKIASGGELSRLMLALKQVHPESDVPTLVFDEVDTGIGGATSALVGEKLKRVSKGQQVLCITHLPQVAAFADHHYLVEKRIEGGRTATAVTSLEGEARVAEMARMLGGVTITGRTMEHAREMIAQGERG